MGPAYDHEMDTKKILQSWPAESQEAAQLVVDTYGEPDEVAPSRLTWYNAGEWKRIIATKEFWEHQFPAPHFDSVESVIDLKVDPRHVSSLAEFDGSVVVRRTMGEISATCHDEEANRLALNLAKDIIDGNRDVADARAYYAKEFADARRKQPTPYMEALRLSPGTDTPDPDERILTDDDLQRAQDEGQNKE